MKARRASWGVLFLVLVLGMAALALPTRAQTAPSTGTLVGIVHDRQQQPVANALVSLSNHPAEVGQSQAEQSLVQAYTQPDGRFALDLGSTDLTTAHAGELNVHIERAHFQSLDLPLDEAQLQRLQAGETISLPEVTMLRKISLAFWIATLIFGGVLVVIASGRLHNTLSALVGATLIFAISYLGHPIREDLFIFDFYGALRYIDWNVIFLIMGMMIVIAVVERTGIFQWLAFSAYRISGGRVWLLLTILMVITGVASAFLDNVTTMLLMTPITVQIALSLEINPLALLIPEVMASNVVGISTLVGTPTNILIGSYGNISFNDFLTNLTPGVILALLGLILYCQWIYRRDLAPQREEETAEEEEGESETISQLLMQKLAERARITEPEHLKKAAWVGAGMLVLFIFGEKVHLLPAVTALIGATALLVWIRPDIEEMIEAVDWTTLVFFMSLFICVGAIQEVGLISMVADVIGRLVGDNLVLAILCVVWLSAILSTVIANIPFTAAMLPVIGFLTATIPGAQSKVLFYCLSVGSAMGGNGSLIGASANMVTAGIAERAGYRISYAYFLRKGFPALLITVTLATIWLLYHF